ncbi:MAG: DoxX family protein [Sphingobacteriaceae bacterium]|nr:MAG: DoxX family protein [Sphingobacteriaceae bacterium]
MKLLKIFYWITTAIVALIMIWSAYLYVTLPKVAEGFAHLGFPSYFRIELAVAKLLGGLALLIPAVPIRVKEWAYAGLGITFISAFIAHYASGDPGSVISGPVVFFILLTISYLLWQRVQKPS